MKIASEQELIVIATAEAETGKRELTTGHFLTDVFVDSLEFVSFIQALRDLGSLSEEAITKAETLGDLANAIVLSR